jgi:outer membrane lipoprotein
MAARVAAINHLWARYGLVLVMSVLLLSSCASSPIETDSDVSSMSVREVRGLITDDDSLTLAEPAPVLWGGVILNTQNLAEITQIEVMGYPLNRTQRPMTGRTAEGRFLVRQEGYLEPLDYAPGRSITVLGSVEGVTSGMVGESAYRYPDVQAQQVHLWDETAPRPRTGVIFGIGVNIGN